MEIRANAAACSMSQSRELDSAIDNYCCIQPAGNKSSGIGEADPSTSLKNLLSAASQPLSQLENLLALLHSLLSSLSSIKGSTSSTEQSKETGSSAPRAELPVAEKTPGTMTFADFVRARIKGNEEGKVSEAEMQYGIVSYQLHQENTKAEAFFQSEYAEALSLGAETEAAVRIALKNTYQAGFIPKSAAEWVNGLSRFSAQFDSSDKLASVEESGLLDFDSAIIHANAALASLVQGLVTAIPMPLEQSSTLKAAAAEQSSSLQRPKLIGGSQAAGFLWKPISEADNKLVVLLPSRLTGLIENAGVYLDDTGEKLLEKGRFAGDRSNGARSHYRFAKSGSAYPNNVYFIVKLKDGSSEAYKINNSAARFEP